MAVSRPGKRVIFAIGALCVALATGAAYRAGYLPGFPKDKSGAREDARGEAPVSVTVAKALTADVPVSLDAVGTVQALNTVTIRPQIDGRLMRLSFTEGQDVRKDDVIAEIDPALYRATYEQAVAKKAQDEANLANARIDLQRYQKLVAGKFLSQQQYSAQQALVQQLEAQVRSDQAAIDSARTTLEYATIRSPINGRAGIRLVDVGNLLRASDQTGIVVITQLKPIFVVFTLPQQALATVQTAQMKGETKVLALGPDNASVIGRGRLAVIDNQIDQLTGTVRLKAEFSNDDMALWPGQFVNVRLMTDTIRNAVVAPSPAVQRGPNGAFVYVLDSDGKARMRPVTTGRQDETQVVLTGGISPGETIIASGFSRLSDGGKVRVIDGDDGKAGKTGEPRDNGAGRRDRAPK